MPNLVEVNYQRTGRSTHTDAREELARRANATGRMVVVSVL
jgi:hypothetical protein